MLQPSSGPALDDHEVTLDPRRPGRGHRRRPAPSDPQPARERPEPHAARHAHHGVQRRCATAMPTLVVEDDGPGIDPAAAAARVRALRARRRRHRPRAAPDSAWRSSTRSATSHGATVTMTSLPELHGTRFEIAFPRRWTWTDADPGAAGDGRAGRVARSDLDDDRQDHRPAPQPVIDERRKVVVQLLLEQVDLVDAVCVARARASARPRHGSPDAGSRPARRTARPGRSPRCRRPGAPSDSEIVATTMKMPSAESIRRSRSATSAGSPISTPSTKIMPDCSGSTEARTLLVDLERQPVVSLEDVVRVDADRLGELAVQVDPLVVAMHRHHIARPHEVQHQLESPRRSRGPRRGSERRRSSPRRSRCGSSRSTVSLTARSLPGIGVAEKTTVSPSRSLIWRWSLCAIRRSAESGSPCEPVEITTTRWSGQSSTSCGWIRIPSGTSMCPSERPIPTFLRIERPTSATLRPSADGGVDHLLHAVDVRGEAGDDDPPLRPRRRPPPDAARRRAPTARSRGGRRWSSRRRAAARPRAPARPAAGRRPARRRPESGRTCSRRSSARCRGHRSARPRRCRGSSASCGSARRRRRRPRSRRRARTSTSSTSRSLCSSSFERAIAIVSREP